MSAQRSALVAALVASTAFAALATQAARAEDPHAIHWGYEGEAGPAHWGDLAPDNAACAAGGQQSPIDLSHAVPASVSAPALMWSAPVSAAITDNGHTWQVDVVDAGGLMHGETPYTLLQFHFHHPAEHSVEGVRHPLEVHFVHRSETGDLAVVGVFFREGAENQALAQLWAAAGQGGQPASARPVEGVDPNAFLPDDGDQFHYAGSLTTPPCSEIVTWTVYAEPLEASAQQIAAFAQRFPMNARPVQPRNRRFLLSTR